MDRPARLGWVLVAAGAALAVAAAWLVLRPDASATREPWSARDADAVEYAAALVAETNEVRADEGLRALAVSSCATGAGVERAQDLVGEELEHAPMTPVLEACAPSTTAAENLARAAAAPHDVVQAWLGSPGHRSNLLDPDLDQVGVGCLLDSDQMLCSQVFLGP